MYRFNSDNRESSSDILPMRKSRSSICAKRKFCFEEVDKHKALFQGMPDLWLSNFSGKVTSRRGIKSDTNPGTYEGKIKN